MNKPAYSCGDAFCCGGENYPSCQLPPTKGATINLMPDGELRITHHEDTAGGRDICPCTD